MEPLTPVARPSLLRFIHDRNPFFPLSALCMFIGYRIVLGAVDSPPGDLRHLLGLIVTLNVYEGLLIALALFLIVRRDLRRDGWMLLTIEALFLVDLTNLNAEFFTANHRLGGLLAGICFILAMVKITVVVRQLGLKLSPGTTFYIALQLALLFGLPGILNMISFRAAITPQQIYLAWWFVAGVIAIGIWLVKSPTRGDDSPLAALPLRLYVLVPLVSLLVHLSSENRVYAIHFHLANVAPVLLAVAAALVVHGWSRRLDVRPGVVLVLCVLAACLSIMPDEYQYALNFHAGCLFSPLRLALIATSAITACLFIRTGLWLSLHASCISAVLALLGSDEPQMTNHSERLANLTVEGLKHAAPRTALQWGYVTIGAAFLLLGIGAAVSLIKPRHRPEPEALSDAGDSADNPEI